MTEVVTGTRGSIGLPFEDFNPLADEIVAFLSVASIVDKEEKLDLVSEAVNIFDEIVLPAVRGNLQDIVLTLLHVQPIDAIDLIECVGGDTVAEAIGWASNVLAEVPSGFRPDEALQALATCMEWEDSIMEASDDIVASAVIYTFIAGINLMLARLAMG